MFFLHASAECIRNFCLLKNCFGKTQISLMHSRNTSPQLMHQVLQRVKERCAFGPLSHCFRGFGHWVRMIIWWKRVAQMKLFHSSSRGSFLACTPWFRWQSNAIQPKLFTKARTMETSHALFSLLSQFLPLLLPSCYIKTDFPAPISPHVTFLISLYLIALPCLSHHPPLHPFKDVLSLSLNMVTAYTFRA